MDKALANRLIDEILAAEPNLAGLSVLCARNEWPGLRRRIAMIMASYVDMTMAIVRKFPDLDPDREDAKPRPVETRREMEFLGDWRGAARGEG